MDPDKFLLTEKEQDGVYGAIFSEYASGRPSLKFPRLVIVAAQPGAGKSAIANQAKNELLAHGGEPVMVDIDETRKFHLRLPEIVSSNPFKMAYYTNRDGWAWTSHLLLDARQTKNNAVYQATIREAKRIDDLVKEFIKGGFAVDLYAIAVSSKESVWGIFNRFEVDIKRAETAVIAPRWVPIPFHNVVYHQFPASVDYLSENAGLERVGVFRRDGTQLYLSYDQLIHRGAGEAIWAERNRLWQQDEKDYFQERWTKLLETAEAREKGVLKPDWYIKHARLLALEAKTFAASMQAPVGQDPVLDQVVLRTPHHVFQQTASGEVVNFPRYRGQPAAIAPAIVVKPSSYPRAAL